MVATTAGSASGEPGIDWRWWVGVGLGRGAVGQGGGSGGGAAGGRATGGARGMDREDGRLCVAFAEDSRANDAKEREEGSGREREGR